jgi:hypothetical protein
MGYKSKYAGMSGRAGIGGAKRIVMKWQKNEQK